MLEEVIEHIAEIAVLHGGAEAMERPEFSPKKFLSQITGKASAKEALGKVNASAEKRINDELLFEVKYHLKRHPNLDTATSDTLKAFESALTEHEEVPPEAKEALENMMGGSNAHAEIRESFQKFASARGELAEKVDKASKLIEGGTYPKKFSLSSRIQTSFGGSLQSKAVKGAGFVGGLYAINDGFKRLHAPEPQGVDENGEPQKGPSKLVALTEMAGGAGASWASLVEGGPSPKSTLEELLKGASKIR